MAEYNSYVTTTMAATTSESAVHNAAASAFTKQINTLKITFMRTQMAVVITNTDGVRDADLSKPLTDPIKA